MSGASWLLEDIVEGHEARLWVENAGTNRGIEVRREEERGGEGEASRMTNNQSMNRWRSVNVVGELLCV
jgi:hypothetical protein